MIVNAKTREILCVIDEKGSVHDFTVYKESIGSAISKNITAKADSGYQGIHQFHENSVIPIKKSKKKPLTDEDKAFNRELSRQRILIENINAQIKVFRSMSSRYRNRRRRHSLRMNLICGIINFDAGF